MATTDTLSIRERIVREYVLALQGLDVAGRNLGPRVWRAWHDPTADTELPYAVVLPMGETKLTGAGGAPMRFYLCELRVDVRVWIRLAPERDEESQIVLHRVLADTARAILDRPLLIGGRGATPDAGTTSLTNWTHEMDNDWEFGLADEMPYYGAIRIGFVTQYRHRDQNHDSQT